MSIEDLFEVNGEVSGLRVAIVGLISLTIVVLSGVVYVSLMHPQLKQEVTSFVSSLRASVYNIFRQPTKPQPYPRERDMQPTSPCRRSFAHQTNE